MTTFWSIDEGMFVMLKGLKPVVYEGYSMRFSDAGLKKLIRPL